MVGNRGESFRVSGTQCDDWGWFVVEKRFFQFLLLSLTILLGSQLVMNQIWPPPPRAKAKPIAKQIAEQNAENDDKPDGAKEQGDPKAVQEAPQQKQKDPVRVEEKPVEVAPDATATERVALGSLDPSSSVRMLVYFTNRGAAIERIALNNPRYGDLEDLEDHSGFFGFLGASDDSNGGLLVGVVGAGTPAATAGIQAGDVITAIDDIIVDKAEKFFTELKRRLPEQNVTVDVRRQGKTIDPITVKLAKRPLQLIRPELNSQPLGPQAGGKHDQLSMLMTLQQVGDKTLTPEEAEFADVSLRDGLWQVSNIDNQEVEFTKSVPSRKLTVIKRYRLARIDEEGEGPAVAYHLRMDIEIINQDTETREIAYRLDGPSGLPTEGWWYSTKFGREWRGRRLRDIAMHFEQGGPQLIAVTAVADAIKEKEPLQIPLLQEGSQTNLLAYAGVDTQYFATVLLPHHADVNQQLFAEVDPILLGSVPEDGKQSHLCNVTCRLISQPNAIAPGEEQRLRQTFTIFAGPKVPSILEQYRPEVFPTVVSLEELIYFGWPIWGWTATPLSRLLHFFHDHVIGNYGVAIIMLTVMVRLCMFPLSRKQALGARKMQELQPEMKRISEKYKGDVEKRSKAIQEMYKKHSYNPLAGCLPMFIQLPIFIGLYRALMVDIELRQAPLISDSVRWCSNLGAPDMFWYWKPFIPAFLSAETGWLGPYLNILPLITVALFVWQQKMFMPPPADEQAAMQQKMMQYMMIFFAFLFFKVASGLCIYFIASSLWGIGERMILPKSSAGPDQAADVRQPKKPVKDPAKSGAASRGSASNRKKKKKK